MKLALVTETFPQEVNGVAMNRGASEAGVPAAAEGLRRTQLRHTFRTAVEHLSRQAVIKMFGIRPAFGAWHKQPLAAWAEGIP